MRLIITIFLTLILGNVSGQTKDSIAIIQKQEKYFLTKTCYDFIKWEEVVLKDKTVNDIINNAIQGAVYDYKLDSSDADLVDARCHKQLEYETQCNVGYAKNNLISCSLTSYTYFTGAPHGERRFSNLNFNAITGDQINFHDLIDSNAVAAVDTLIIQKLTDRLKGFDTDFDYWKQQLSNLEFTIGDNGIDILFRGDIYVLSIIDVILTKEELKPFVNRKGILKKYYESNK